MKKPEKKLVQTLLQGGNRLYGIAQDASSIAKSFSRYTLENDWNFSPRVVSPPVGDSEEQFPHIRTLRFFLKEKELFDESLMNTFTWEHYKRNLNFHPLVSLEILNTKFSRDALDLPLLNQVGGQRLEFLRMKRGGRYKDLYRRGDPVMFPTIEIEKARQQLSVLLEKHGAWIHQDKWPTSLKSKDAKLWYDAIAVLDHEYLISFFGSEVGVWCNNWLELSENLPGIAQMKLLDAFRDQDKAVLNGFYARFLQVEMDELLGKMDFSILLRALGKKYVSHAMSEMATLDRLPKRWKSIVHLAFSNYQPWDSTDIKRFIVVYKFLASDKEKERWAITWRNIGFNRFGQTSQQELMKALRSEFKSEADYEWIPILENIMRARSGMMGAF